MDEERRNAVRDIAEALARLNIQNAEIIGNQRMPGPSERRGGGFSPLHLKLLQESDFLPEFSDLIRKINRSICAGRTGGTEESDVSEKERKVSKVFRNASVVREELQAPEISSAGPVSGTALNVSEVCREDPVPGSVCLRNRPCRMRDAGIACSPASVFCPKTEILKGIDVMRLLSDIYYSSFYLDICSGEYQVIRLAPWLISSIPERGNFDAVFAAVARHLILPQYREEFQRKFCIEYIRENLNREKSNFVFDYQVMRDKGASWCRISAVLSDETKDGMSNHVLILLQDVTEQKKIEQEEDHSRVTYRSGLEETLELARTGLWTIEMEEGCEPRMYAGNSMKKLLGVKSDISPEECYRAWYDRIEPGYEEAVQASVDEMLSSGRSEVAYPWNHPTQGQIYVRCGGVHDKSFEHPGFRLKGYHQDITQTVAINKQQEKELERANIILKRQLKVTQSLGSIYEFIYYLNLKDDTFSVISDQSSIRQFMTEESFANQKLMTAVRALISEGDWNIVREFLDFGTLDRRMEDREIVSMEFLSAEQIWYRASFISAYRGRDGSLVQVLFVIQLIDEEKRKELDANRAVREAYKAAQYANSAKTNFLSHMSHDIRTPMNAIIGMTALAGTHLDDPARVQDCLGKISVSSRHLLNLINDVLDMSKIESGKMAFNEEEIRLPRLIDNLLEMVRPSVNAKKHRLFVHVQDLQHEDILGDSLRIQQIFTNIMSNAVKYTPEGGRIEFYIREKSCRQQNVGCYEFIFKDSGIGMSGEFMEHLFEPFQRAEDARMNSEQGTGLGMAITRTIVQMMEGDIRVESRVGAGSTFTVTIFLKLQNTQDVSTEELAGLPVLVADDDEISCESTCLLLSDIGIRGEYVMSGEEAVRRVVEAHAAQDDFFAVIIDWKMPEMDGIQTTRKIRSAVGDDVPIIVFSAYDWTEIEQEARMAGVDAFISKPLFKSRLTSLFKSLVSGEEEPSEKPLNLLSESDFSGKRVLLVEDNDLNQEIAQEILKMAGLTVEIAENGKEAVRLFSGMPENYYDMILMDIQMPLMNGYEAAEALRSMEREDAQNVPIIAMTANAFADDVLAAKNAGMNEHIAKPLDMLRLQELLEDYLNR